MKTTILLLLCFLSYTALRAQNTSLTGTWTMFEYSWTNDQGKQTTSEDKIKADGGVTEYLFMDDGNFKLSSNMADESAIPEIGIIIVHKNLAGYCRVNYITL